MKGMPEFGGPEWNLVCMLREGSVKAGMLREKRSQLPSRERSGRYENRL